MELKERKIVSGEFIAFVDLTEQYGRAEFVICPEFKRGKLVKVTIWPRQQPDAKEYFVWEGKAEGLSFTGYEGLDGPRIWITYWCKEHKCHSMELYVPVDAKYLWIDYSVGKFCVNFTKTKWK